jgi:hypothetical protein
MSGRIFKDDSAYLARIAELEAQVAKANAPKALKFKVSPKGAVSVYGMQRFPVTLYKGQWAQLLAQAEALQSFIEANKSMLREKE